MKNFIRIMLGLILGAALALGAATFYGRMSRKIIPTATFNFPEDPAAIVTHLAGPVFLIRNGEEILPAHPGDRLMPGDIIKVTNGAMAQIQLANRGTAKVGSDTLLRFRKIAGAGEGLEVRTEILTGSLFYRINKLANNDVMFIEVDDIIYEVKGTVFFLEKRNNEIFLATAKGKVLVKSKVEQTFVEAGEELRLTIGSPQPASPMPLSSEAKVKLQEGLSLQELPFPTEASTVRVVLTTLPPDATIYLEGIKTGTGRFSGLFIKGSVLHIRARRPGFSDTEMSLVANRNIQQVITLKPLDLEESLSEPPPESLLLKKLREDYEDRLSTLWRDLKNQGQETVSTQKLLQTERSRRQEEITTLQERSAQQLQEERRKSQQALKEEQDKRLQVEAELTESQETTKLLKELLAQIESLSSTENP